MTAKRSAEPFEQLYTKLEQAVEKLEKGGLSLEDSITLYEEGMELAKRCQVLLDNAELRITKLRESFTERAPPPVPSVADSDGALNEDIPFDEDAPPDVDE